MYSDRNFLIFPVTELPKVDFSQVCESSIDTVRKSVSDKTFVKWDGEVPAFVADIESAEGPYTYEEILEILATEEWTSAPVEGIV